MQKLDAGYHVRILESTPMTTDQFDTLLADHGAQAALSHLNSTVPHRYTALYRLDQGVMTNILLVDKRDEVRPEFLASVPFEDSFCQFVLKLGRFTTVDSAADERLDGHKYQGVMVSYSGVPVSTSDERLWGTLCHFDTAQWEMPDASFEMLRRAARQLALRPPVIAI